MREGGGDILTHGSDNAAGKRAGEAVFWEAALEPKLWKLSLPAPLPSCLQGAQVPRDFEPMQGKKGWKRYTSPDLRQLVRAREETVDQRERALSGILQVGGVAGSWAALASFESHLETSAAGECGLVGWALPAGACQVGCPR